MLAQISSSATITTSMRNDETYVLSPPLSDSSTFPIGGDQQLRISSFIKTLSRKGKENDNIIRQFKETRNLVNSMMTGDEVTSLPMLSTNDSPRMSRSFLYPPAIRAKG